MKIYLLKKCDLLIGRLAISLLNAPENRTIYLPVSSLLLIRPGGIGDAVHLAPTIRSLKNTFPGVHITILAERRNSGCFHLVPGVDKLLCYDTPRELFQALHASYDGVIDSEQWHRLSTVVARITTAPVKIGFNTNERRRMFTHRIPYGQDDYEAVSFTKLLEPLGHDLESVDTASPFLTVSAMMRDKAASLLAPLDANLFISIFPGASIAERRWGVDRFRNLSEVLLSAGIKTVVVGGNKDFHMGKVIVSGGSGLNLAGQTSLAETAAVIQKSALLISGDSGVLHIAVGLNIPTVSLFGPGRAKKWAPRGERHIVINKELPCSPCTTFGNTPPCPINAKCMSDITVEDVVNAATTLLKRVGAVSNADQAQK